MYMRVYGRLTGSNFMQSILNPRYALVSTSASAVDLRRAAGRARDS